MHRSVRLQCQLQLNIRATIHEVFHKKRLIRESDHPGIVFPGNVLSGKMTIRETTFRETSFREKNHPGK